MSGGDCLKCGAHYETEPALAVPCPICHRPAGSPCVSRSPSGHVKSRAFQGLPPWGHDLREIDAALAGAYSKCQPSCHATLDAMRYTRDRLIGGRYKS